jgi:hypothetical protein
MLELSQLGAAVNWQLADGFTGSPQSMEDFALTPHHATVSLVLSHKTSLVYPIAVMLWAVLQGLTHKGFQSIIGNENLTTAAALAAAGPIT